MSNLQLDHPPRERLQAFGWGRLAEDEAAEIETHLRECETCCALVEATSDNDLIGLLREADRTPSTAIQPSAGSSADSAIPAELANHPRYRVLGPLGAGGMGTVYTAEHRLMERRVALKIISAKLVDSPIAVERFRREVKAAASLAHPNIVNAYDADQAGELHFLVMEHVPGRSLAEVVEDHGRLDIEQACAYVRQAALGLQHAHERGIVHRDIKPQNLIISDGGHPEGGNRRGGEPPSAMVKILDFGLAHFRVRGLSAATIPGGGERDTASESSGACTRFGQLMGTVDFMAPEQALDAHHADIRADIYSLGCTLYYLLAGRPPFADGTREEKLHAHARQAARPLAEIRPDVPAKLPRILERMMAKDPAQRYQTPAEVAEALAPFSGIATMPRRSITFFVAAAAALLLALAAVDFATLQYSPALYRFATNQGQLVIETEDPDVEVKVSRNGELIEIIDAKSKKNIWLRAGAYQLELTEGKDGLRLSTREFTLERGGEAIVRVWLEPPQPLADGEVRRFTGSDGVVMSVAFSPDGRYALSTTGGEHDKKGNDLPGPDYSIRLWDVKTGRLVHRFEGHTGWVVSAVFSKDGKHILSGSGDKTVRMWHIKTRQELFRLECPAGVVRVALSPDNRHALSASMKGGVQYWDLQKRELKRQHDQPPGIRVWCVAFVPETEHFVCCGFWENAVRLCDLDTGKVVRRFTGHQGQVWGLAVSADGRRLLTGSGDFTVRLWDVASGTQLQSCKGHTAHVRSVAFAPDGRYAASGSGNWFDENASDCNLRLWSLETGKQVQCFEGHRRPIWGIAFAPDGRSVLSGSGDKTVRLWKAPELPAAKAGSVSSVPVVAEHLRLVGHAGRVYSVALSKDGRRMLSGGTDGTVRLWDAESGKELRCMREHTGRVTKVVFSPDEHHALSSGWDRTLRFWDVQSGQEVRRFEGCLGAIWCVAFTRDGRHAISGSWDRETDGFDRPIFRDGLPIPDHALRLWDIATGKPLRHFDVANAGLARSVAISPDGQHLLSSHLDKTLRLRDLSSGKQLQRLEGHVDHASAVAFSPDGRQAVSAGYRDKTVRLWDLESGRQLQCLEHSHPVHGVAFAPDGRHVVSACFDHANHLWNVETGKEICRFVGHSGASLDVTISRDGKRIVSGGIDGTVRVWQAP